MFFLGCIDYLVYDELYIVGFFFCFFVYGCLCYIFGWWNILIFFLMGIGENFVCLFVGWEYDWWWLGINFFFFVFLFLVGEFIWIVSLFILDVGIFCCWKNYLLKCLVIEERVFKKVKVIYVMWLIVGVGELYVGR